MFIVKEAKKNEAPRTQTSQNRFERRGAYGPTCEFRANGCDSSTQMEGVWHGEASQGSSRYANEDVKGPSVQGPRHTDTAAPTVGLMRREMNFTLS
jgi:hypothetical protein